MAAEINTRGKGGSAKPAERIHFLVVDKGRKNQELLDKILLLDPRLSFSVAEDKNGLKPHRTEGYSGVLWFTALDSAEVTASIKNIFDIDVGAEFGKNAVIINTAETGQSRTVISNAESMGTKGMLTKYDPNVRFISGETAKIHYEFLEDPASTRAHERIVFSAMQIVSRELSKEPEKGK